MLENNGGLVFGMHKYEFSVRRGQKLQDIEFQSLSGGAAVLPALELCNDRRHRKLSRGLARNRIPVVLFEFDVTIHIQDIRAAGHVVEPDSADLVAPGCGIVEVAIREGVPIDREAALGHRAARGVVDVGDHEPFDAFLQPVDGGSLLARSGRNNRRELVHDPSRTTGDSSAQVQFQIFGVMWRGVVLGHDHADVIGIRGHRIRNVGVRDIVAHVVARPEVGDVGHRAAPKLHVARGLNLIAVFQRLDGAERAVFGRRRRAEQHLVVRQVLGIHRNGIQNHGPSHIASARVERVGRKDAASAFVAVHFENDAHLFQVVGATRAARRFARPCQSRQQDGRQNTNNRDDD